MDDMAIRCAECKWEVDEFTAIAEGWRYFSDGCGDLTPFCPACARREFAPERSRERANGVEPEQRWEVQPRPQASLIPSNERSREV